MKKKTKKKLKEFVGKPMPRIKEILSADKSKEFSIRYKADKQLWAVETKDLEIIRGLVGRYGKETTVLDFLNKINKDIEVLY